MKKIIFLLKLVLLLQVANFFNPLLIAVDKKSDILFDEFEKKIPGLMEKGNIPGLSLSIVDCTNTDRPVYTKGFGYANLEKSIPVTPDTLFELASCSKGFTALAAVQLEKQGLLDLDEPVSRYLPWFYVLYENEKVELTLRQALHHTTGIPWNSIQTIPMGDDEGALEQAVRNIVGIKLDNKPGTCCRYTTINFDIIGLIIEKVTDMKYEDYMETHLFPSLGLRDTMVGTHREDPTVLKKMAVGYKIGFFAPRKYVAPPYRGNSPAGYIVSNGKDMIRWLKLQMLVEESPLNPLIQKTQQRDKTVPPTISNMFSYAMGWQVSLTGDGEVRHGGLNPNYTAYIAFRPGKKIGVAVLANSNSHYTAFIGKSVMNLLLGIEIKDPVKFGATMDSVTSVISIVLCLIILIIMTFIGTIWVDLCKGRRRFESFTWKKVGKIFVAIPIILPFLLGIYLLPLAMSNVSWKFTLVWSSVSFKTAILLLLMVFGVGYLGYVLSIIFPQKNKYIKSFPLLILLSILTGGANTVIIFLITSSLYSKTKLVYMLYYFGLAMILYVLGRKVLKTKLTKVTFDIVYDIRMTLIEKIFHTSYQKFEKMDHGRVFTTLNDDIGQVGNSANTIVTFLTGIITVIGTFLYLAVIAFWATIVTLGIIISLTMLYYLISRKVQPYLEEARDTQNVYMRLLNGMIDGFKELNIHFNKKKEYRNDMEKSTNEFRNKSVTARVKFINTVMIGESMLVVLLGIVAFAIPQLFPQIQTFTIMSFIMVLLYLIGPIIAILSTIPGILQLKVAWKRIQGFINDIPANMKPQDLENLKTNIKNVEYLQIKNLMFQYKNEGEDKPFTLGPIDFETKKGEIVFIVGGNGSGKTTLAKLLTGLYIPDSGTISVDGEEVANYQLGEYYSTVFSDYHLFEKLYNIDLNNKREEAQRYLKMLRLEDKLSLHQDSFSTINLSGGQRKRLALLLCYLEDCPIYLFDEVAADQDPGFRQFFYRELLKQMKEIGKIVIAITHDDHYFDVADKIIKMDTGKIETVERLTEGIDKEKQAAVIQTAHWYTKNHLA